MGIADVRLGELATSISDGAFIDWETWERESQDVEAKSLVDSLHRIAQIADACRSLQSERSGDDLPADAPAHWGHLEILEIVGRGASGDVFRARDPRVGRDVALKLLLRKPSGTPDGVIREAHLLAKVKHPNVATIYGADEREGIVGIWTELLEGPTLESRVSQEGPFSVEEAARIGVDVCRALAAVHSVEMLHRDVKAENIVLQDGERAVLMDFGVGVEFTDPADTETRDICGTPRYLAPEVFHRSPQTVASDLYSVGVLLYHLVTGDFPVAARDAEELREAHREGRARSLKEASPELPDAFTRIVDRALRPAPEERFATAEAMADVLEALVRKLEPRRRRPRIHALVLAAVLVIAALAALFYRSTPVAVVSPGSQVLMASIDNRTGDHRFDAVQTLLESELRQSSHVQLVEETRIRSALTRMVRSPSEDRDLETSREVAWRLGAPLVLGGALLPVGSGYSLSLQLDLLEKRAPTPVAGWSRVFHADDENDLFGAVDAASRWVRRTAGEQSASIAELDLPVREMTTPSWEALELFHRAEELKQEGRWQDAILLLQESVEVDPDFAMARMRLGDLFSSLTEAEASHHWEKALESIKRRPVSKREELNIRGMYAIDSGAFAEAEAPYRTLSLLYPNDYRASYYHGLTLRVLARYREALGRLLEAERKSPEPLYNVLVQIAGTYLALDYWEQVPAYIEKLRAIHAVGWADAFQGALRFLEGGHEEAEALFRGMTVNPELEMASLGYSLLAAALGELGRYDEAADVLREGIENDVSWGRPSTRARKLLDLAYVLTLQGKVEKARAACLEALELERGPHQIALAGTLLARSGFLNEARGLLSEMASESDKPLYRRVELQLTGEIHLADGETEQALQALRQAAALDRPGPKPYMAHALHVSGHLREAADAYAEIARAEGLVWMKRICDLPDPPGFFSVALEKYEETARSVRLYDQVERARKRLGTLRPDRVH
ncbi:MAG TPA: serine/threonine-protein kinase [Vicinamibacteria bacterium]|nr:serine/threonine-protein kinase [Vicinamibacteria bacterium]